MNNKQDFSKIPAAKKNLTKKRGQLRQEYESENKGVFLDLAAIGKRSANDENAKFDDLIRIISNEAILYNAVGTMSKKKGALTEGPKIDTQTSDSISKQLITNISNELKSGTFRFKPIRRVYMERSGKAPASKDKQSKLKEIHKKEPVSMDEIKAIGTRPLGISSFTDKIVQEAMRMVLNAIYEPEFARQNVNFGFRPSYGCHNAIEHIQNYAKQMDFAIEGDIKGAFDNVNHDILMKILERKVLDRKFLNLIKGGLKCGVMYLNFIQDSDLGTTQGSVVSPILYNIYFNEFDKFINTEFKKKVQEINEKENRTNRPVNKLYNAYSKKKTKLKLREKINSAKQYREQHGLDGKLKSMTKEIKRTIKEYKNLDALQKKTSSFAKSRQTIRFSYTRYADDWVFFTNATIDRVKEWKDLFSEIITKKLELTLSPDKTKITDLRKKEKVKFLGFQLVRALQGRVATVGYKKLTFVDYSNRLKKSYRVINDPEPKKLQFKTRTTNPTLIVSWDRDRVLNRLIESGFITKFGKTYRGRSKNPWTVLSEIEIVERFNYVIRGYLEYYTPVAKYQNDTHYLWYLLYYSCANTIARKRQISLRELFHKFGRGLNIKAILKENIKDQQGNEKQRTEIKKVKILEWKDCQKIISQIMIRTRKKQSGKTNDKLSIITKSIDSITDIKINWRTSYKLTKECPICGSSENLEYHHHKPIRIGRATGFTQILKQLNRRQIPVCRMCHKNIHAGKYDGLALNQLYNSELIIL